ncbi:hypothetical protein A3K63_01115 [Candidatus Micrarchaeota archaeon RBG_16_49_10]|nr:MAG: hypothetical protein A3K63_01115 [Candidatus Micrarchaeota archaeon RBG_16_49_10]
MKILIAHEIFYPEVSGGGEKIVLELAKGLLERGHEVKIFTSGDPKIKQYEGIETVRLPVNRYLLSLSLPLISKHTKDCDLVQISTGNLTFPAFYASRIHKKPSVCTAYHLFGPFWKDVKGPLIGTAFQKFEKSYLTRDYDAFVFMNRYTEKLGLDAGVNKGKAHLIHPGFDYEKYKPKKMKKEPFVLLVGNFAMNESMLRVKGTYNLIEAAKMLPETDFVIVGGGSGIENLKKKSPNNVKFLGPMKFEDFAEYYNRALIFCHPSLSESFSLAILEAMAYGCSVVSAIDLGQKGIRIRVKDTEDIANGIKHLLNNTGKTISMGRENMKIAKKFTWKKFIADYEKLYQSLV